MHRIDFIQKPRADGGPARGVRAFLASCIFHGLLLGSIVGLSFIYQSHLTPPKSGSAPGSPTITLETMVIVSPPPQSAPQVPPPPVSKAPAASQPAMVRISTPPSRETAATPKPPEATVPVLAVQPGRPMPAIQPIAAKPRAAIHPAISHPAAATAQSSPPKPAAPASSSSYAPGLNVLPHPPYPLEARDRGQTGTVVMDVQFDSEGNVAQAEVAQSSGVPILDSETRSFIRTHWHSAAYAGQTISQPVRYSLENL